MVKPHTTITSVVTVETSIPIQNHDTQTTAQKNSKLIGGLVGSIGGTIFIGVLVVLFLFLKRRKKLTNQSPDFNDSSLDEERKDSSDKSTGFSFKKLFGSKAATGPMLAGGTGNVAGIQDLERNMNTPNYGSLAAAPPLPSGQDSGGDDDFFYRGVTNNNNLDSVFRTTPTSNSGQGSIKRGENTNSSSRGHSRFNSFGHPFANEDQFVFNENQENEENQLLSNDEPAIVEDESSYSDFNPSDYEEDGLPGADMAPTNNTPYPIEDPHSINPALGNLPDAGSNNSRSRFTEEII